MMFGYVRKRGIGYVVGLDSDGSGTGYHVVSKDIDPYNRYDIDEVLAYIKANPDKLLAEVTPTDSLEEDARRDRDKRIDAVEWRVTRYNTQVQLGITPTETDITPVLEYMQALRDLPETEGWPENIVWPKEP